VRIGRPPTRQPGTSRRRLPGLSATGRAMRPFARPRLKKLLF
jgi:hypothetical protein